MVNSNIRHCLFNINPQQLEFFLVKTLKCGVSFFSAKCLDKSKTVKVFFSKNIKMLRQGCVRVASGFSQQKVKVNSKHSNRQGGQGLKKLLVNFRQSQLKDKTRLIQDKSTKVRVFLGQLKDKTRLILDKSTTVRVLSKNIKRLRQGFFSEKLSKNIKRLRQDFLSEKLKQSQNKVIGREAKVLRSFKYGLLKVNSTIRHEKSKINQKESEFFLVKTLKGCVSVFSAKC
ncbi:hypothetical protein M0802_015951 [Mischocyttarus mexicanus]|nr:hypothetical protein M0802_015951 [Mischocyttarus mexicanus]